jgi:hypothetical protein
MLCPGWSLILAGSIHCNDLGGALGQEIQQPSQSDQILAARIPDYQEFWGLIVGDCCNGPMGLLVDQG